jgi:chemotaxis protein CheX
LLENSTREVFETMLGETARPAVYGEDEVPAATDFTALVGLSGGLCGALSVRCQAAAAYRIGVRMMGDNQPFFAEEYVSDALGEIANMVAGSFKAKLPGMADACRLSVPTVFHGTELTCDPAMDGESLESCFTFHGQPFWVNLNLWNEPVIRVRGAAK